MVYVGKRFTTQFRTIPPLYYGEVGFYDLGAGVSNQAEVVRDQYKEVVSQTSTPISKQNNFQRFSNLAETWKEESQFSSSITDIAMSPAYQQIIGMGEVALPFIFHDLEKEHNHWFWALSAITGVDPVKSGDKGNIQKMTEAWLSWGKSNGYFI